MRHIGGRVDGVDHTKDIASDRLERTGITMTDSSRWRGSRGRRGNIVVAVDVGVVTVVVGVGVVVGMAVVVSTKPVSIA